MAAGRKHAVPLRPARLLLGAALLHSVRSEDLFRACPTEHVRGVLFHFESSYEIYNNLGGYPGGDGVDCLESASSLPPDHFCPCGCGCRCSNPEQAAPAGTPQELRYGDVATFVGSDGMARSLDLVVTNLTEYTPWTSLSNGQHVGGHFAQISLRQDTSTRFEYELRDSSTGQPFSVANGAAGAHVALAAPPAPLCASSRGHALPSSPSACGPITLS